MAKEPKGVRLDHISKIYQDPKTHEDFFAVKDVSLDIAPGEFITLLGPSGCGKTTTLRMVAGFESPDEGEIYLGNEAINELTPNKRDTAMVFQSYALFPHMNIFENIAYGLRVEKLPRSEIIERTAHVIDMMQLKGMEGRFPNQLSGGQQQRVALARAVVIEPSVLLFDEPLSNLDAKLRESMRDELRALQKRLGITSLYVTHDQSEAMAISDRVVIMKDGNIMQHGSPVEIYEKPASRFVANFIGKANFVEGVFRGKHQDGSAVVEVLGKELLFPNPGDMQEIEMNGPCCLSVRPESISLSRDSGDFPGRVTRATYYGAKIEYEIMLQEQPIIVEIYNPQLTERFMEGEEVYMTFIDKCVRVLR